METVEEGSAGRVMSGAPGQCTKIGMWYFSQRDRFGVSAEGLVVCLFECGEESPYERISLARFTLEWLLERPV